MVAVVSTELIIRHFDSKINTHYIFARSELYIYMLKYITLVAKCFRQLYLQWNKNAIEDNDIGETELHTSRRECHKEPVQIHEKI